jgi:death-on-curing protein
LLQNEPTWLTDSQVIEINKRLVAETGEPHFLRDAYLLSSALARPKNRWFYDDYDIVNLAGSLLLGIGQNHPFEQGNKRTALAAAAVFLSLNGYTLVDVEPLATFIAIQGEWSSTIASLERVHNLGVMARMLLNGESRFFSGCDVNGLGVAKRSPATTSTLEA